MATVTRRTRLFDRSSLGAYIGAGAAIVFIAAMTVGAIDAPSERREWMAETPAPQATHLVSAAQQAGEPRIR